VHTALKAKLLGDEPHLQAQLGRCVWLPVAALEVVVHVKELASLLHAAREEGEPIHLHANAGLRALALQNSRSVYKKPWGVPFPLHTKGNLQ
jgi:hypothetical protein